MNRIIFIYLVSGLVVQSDLVEPTLAISRMVVNLAITMLFTYLVLMSLELKARFVQTLTALVGVGIVFNLLAWPLLMHMGQGAASEPVEGIISFLIVLLMGWELLVTAHIYRHALSAKMASAVALSLGLFIVSVTLSQMLFPES